MATMETMLERVRLELRDSNPETPAGVAESADTLEDDELETVINEQLLFHTHGRTTGGVVYTLSTLPPIEVPLLALGVAIQVLWTLSNEAAREVDVHLVEGITLPAAQRYAQIVAQIDRLQARYDDYANYLGLGIHRIEMLTLRRVSRTTGRLVPVYVPQEYDDLTYPPVRVLPPIDSGLL